MKAKNIAVPIVEIMITNGVPYQVLKQGLLHLNDVLKNLEPLHKPLDSPGGSVLLRELVTAPELAQATSNPQVSIMYRVGIKSGPHVDSIFQATLDRSVRQQQKKNSSDLAPSFWPSPVQFTIVIGRNNGCTVCHDSHEQGCADPLPFDFCYWEIS